MRRFTYSTDELNTLVYTVRDIEMQYQKAKDDYDILDDSGKDVLASLINQISSVSDIPQIKAETQARASNDWKTYKQGLYASQRTFGEASMKYKHILRVFDAFINGLSFEKEKLKRGMADKI